MFDCSSGVPRVKTLLRCLFTAAAVGSFLVCRRDAGERLSQPPWHDGSGFVSRNVAFYITSGLPQSAYLWEIRKLNDPLHQQIPHGNQGQEMVIWRGEERFGELSANGCAWTHSGIMEPESLNGHNTHTFSKKVEGLRTFAFSWYNINQKNKISSSKLQTLKYIWNWLC